MYSSESGRHPFDNKHEKNHLLNSSESDSEEHSAPVSSAKHGSTNHATRSKRTLRVVWSMILCCFLLSVSSFLLFWGRRSAPQAVDRKSAQAGPLPPSESSELCPQAPPLLPVRHAGLAKTLDSVYASDDYKLNAYTVLGGAIQIPTETYDDLGPVGIDPRWNVFAKFHDYLEKSFPTVFATLEVTKVNTYGIVLRWEGSDPFLYPVLITAHQDVVPVDPATAKEWIHPPYSGYYDGKHAVSTLLQQGFKPNRTVVLAFGFDEEASGMEGAGNLARYLEREYGRDGFAILLDEGDYYGTPYGDDVIFATPSVAEKGYIDIRIEVTAKGGHSSVPPPHTSIGALSAMVVALEAHPHPTVLERGGNPYNSTMCAAAYGLTFPENIRQLAFKAAGQNLDSNRRDPEDEVERQWDDLNARKAARAARLQADRARRAWWGARREARKVQNHAKTTMREALQQARDDWNEGKSEFWESWEMMKEGWIDLSEGLKDVWLELKLIFNDIVHFRFRRRTLRNSDGALEDTVEKLKDALIQEYPIYDAILRTTQAVDLVSGGVKVSALPELAAAVVNHRIAQHSGIVDVQAHVKTVILPVAEQFNLTMNAFGYWVPAGDGGGGHVELTDSWYAGLEPSPITPTGPEDPYQILAGTIKATLQSARGYNASGVVVAPKLALGNTDTQFYWGLTKHINRYSHLSEKDLYNGLHTVNEAVRGEGWIESIRFYTRFILNCDEHLRVGNF